MTKAAYFSIGLIVLCGTVVIGRAQSTATDAAVKQAVQREADRVTLRQKLGAAQEAEDRKDLSAAAKLYEAAYKLVLNIGNNIDAEREATIAGYTRVHLELARAAQKVGDFHEAKTHLTLVLKVDPLNATGLSLMKENEGVLATLKGREPSPAVLERVGEIHEEKVTAGTHVQNGRLLLEMGKIDEAEEELKAALRLEPENQPAYYYLSFVKEARYRQLDRLREQHSKDSAIQVEQEWSSADLRKSLLVPNPFATNTLIWTGSGRQAIVSKLNSTKLDSVFYDGLPLSEVVRNLSDETKKRDPLKKGLNFIINPNSQVAAAPAGPTAIDATTGLPIAAPPQEAVDVGSIPVKINPALTDMRLADVLDIIVKVADRPIKYSIEEWGIMFSLKGVETQPLFMREFKVDPNTFYQGLESVGTLIVGDIQSTSGGGGGSQGGGGGGGGGGGQGGQGNAGIGIPRVNVAGGSIQGGSQGGQGGGQQGGGGGGGGVRFLTRTNNMEEVHTAVRNFFTIMGIDLNIPKSVFFNDRAGILLVNATLQDLDNIDKIIQVLNVVPHQISIKAKFVEIDQLDSKALGFNWFLGNMTIGNSVLASAGTQPSFNGRPSTANPGGTFPGTTTVNPDGTVSTTTTAPSGSDGLLTGGLRNQVGRQGGDLGTVAPALASFTGILTDPQFKVVITALEQRSGADLLNAPEVVTPSGRQAQIQIVDIITIVSGTSLNQNASGTGGGTGTTVTTGGGGAVGTTVDYPTTPIPVGTTLDVIPYISADGYTIQMTIIPTITEFVGYDDPGQFIPQGQSVAGNNIGSTITAQLPLPRTRVRQVTTSAVVWDGQTVVLGGLISENVIRFKDKVPLLGDLPWLGKLFRSESSQTSKRNLVIFVTPTIIDPAGNRLHVDGTMPFDMNSIPRASGPSGKGRKHLENDDSRKGPISLQN